jgi:hypothetical protein
VDIGNVKTRLIAIVDGKIHKRASQRYGASMVTDLFYKLLREGNGVEDLNQLSVPNYYDQLKVSCAAVAKSIDDAFKSEGYVSYREGKHKFNSFS